MDKERKKKERKLDRRKEGRKEGRKEERSVRRHESWFKRYGGGRHESRRMMMKRGKIKLNLPI